MSTRGESPLFMSQSRAPHLAICFASYPVTCCPVPNDSTRRSLKFCTFNVRFCNKHLKIIIMSTLAKKVENHISDGSLYTVANNDLTSSCVLENHGIQGLDIHGYLAYLHQSRQKVWGLSKEFLTVYSTLPAARPPACSSLIACVIATYVCHSHKRHSDCLSQKSWLSCLNCAYILSMKV